MDKKISDKQVIDLISEFAKTSGADITQKDIQKEFADEINDEANSNIVVVENNNEDDIKNQLIAGQKEILPLLNSIHNSIANLQNVKDKHSADLQIDEILDYLKNNLDEKIIVIEQKLNEIIFKNQSSKFLLEDTKNIIASTTSQKIELEKIQKEVAEFSKLFKDYKPFSKEEKIDFKEDFLKSTSTLFTSLDNRIKKAEENLSKLTIENKPSGIMIPKWALLLMFVSIATLFGMFFYILNQKKSKFNEVEYKKFIEKQEYYNRLQQAEIEKEKVKTKTSTIPTHSSEITNNKANQSPTNIIANSKPKKGIDPSSIFEKNNSSKKEINQIKKLKTATKTGNTSNIINTTKPQTKNTNSNDVFFGRD